MRKTRLLLAAAAVGVFALIGLGASPASASETEEACLAKAVHEHGITEADASDLTKAQEDAISACFEAPNPLLPEISEVIWGAVGFAVVVGFLYWKGVPAVRKTMDDRAEKIRTDIATAETERAEASQVLVDYRAQLADARSESARIIEEARQTADLLKQQLSAQAQEDIAEMRRQAAADVDAAKAQAIADLHNEVTSLAIGAAEQVVQRNLDQDTNVALVEAYINQVGARN